MRPRLLVSATVAFKAELEKGEGTGNATACSPMPLSIYHSVIIQKPFQKRFAKTEKEPILGKGEEIRKY